MKWGRNKLHSSESSSSRNSFISHLFPVSWLSKFKHKSGDAEAKPVKRKQEGQRNSTFVASPKYIGDRGGRFYGGGEGDTFWRLSFGDEGDQGKTSGGDLRPVWDGSGDKLDVPPSNSGTTLMGNEDIRKFNNLLIDARKTKECQRNVGTSPEMDVFKNEEVGIVKKTLKVTTTKEQKSKKTNLSVPKETWSKPEGFPDETEEKSRRSLEKKNSEFEMLPIMARQKCKIIRPDMKKHGYIPATNWTTFKEDDVQPFQTFKGVSAGKVSSEWERLKEKKIKEVKCKNETHRKSLYISRELQTRKTNQSSKLKVGGSPRIKALEDMKKAKLKMKKGKEKTLKGTSLESFAVVKCSFEPQKDFRDSMIEMILEKRLSQPEELEELLACYLTLNSDEYHDLIIKVFRQVWSDLNQASFHQLHDEKYFHYY